MKEFVSINMQKAKTLSYRKCWTLKELANHAHISLDTVFALQAKRRKATLLTLNKLAAALDVAPADLVEKD